MSNELARPEQRCAPVLRVIHAVDESGRVHSVELEPLGESMEAARAAYWAAGRSIRFIVGDDEADAILAAREIALAQVNRLLAAADGLLFTIQHARPAPRHGKAAEDDAWLKGYRAAIQDLRRVQSVEHLRGCAQDLRGYLPALCGKLPQSQLELTPEARAIERHK